MSSLNEQRLIRGTAIGLFIAAFLLFYFNITVNNNKLNIFSDFSSLNFYTTFGFIMLGNLIPYFALNRSRLEHLFVFIAGSAFAVAIWFFHPTSWNLSFWSESYLFLSFIGYGGASIVVVLFGKSGVDPLDTRPDTRQKMIDFYIFLNLLQFSIYTILDLTTLLHPFTFDTVAYRIDATFGMLPSVFVAQLYSQYGWFAATLNAAYDWAPVAFAFIFMLQLRHKSTPPANMITVWAVATVACLIAYHFCPIAGPVYVFGSDVFPNAMPATEQINYVSTLTKAAFRNGFPSMHFGACLMFIFTARYQKSIVLNLFLYITAVLVFLATLGKGEHYLVDLIASFPFIVAIQAFCTRVTEAGEPLRKQAIGLGIVLWLVWVVLVREGFILFYYIPGFTWIVSIGTIALSLYAYKRIWPYEMWGYVEPQKQPAAEMNWSNSNLIIPILFFASGFTGLMYEVIFSKVLALTFGGMATATYTVLAVYMGGMAIGAWLGGLVMHRTKKNGLVLYAICELIIGVYCLVTPILFFLVKELYVLLAANSAPDVPGLTVLRVLCGGLVLLIPTILMGMTLPVMVTELQRKGQGIGSSVARLYSANTLGAALGALLSGYLILPALGVITSIALSAMGSMLVALLALKLNKKQSTTGVLHEHERSEIKINPTVVRPELMWAGLFTLFLIGTVTLLMEVNYMQLLAVVAGNSVYAFSLMLFSLLIGLGVGASLAKYILKKAVPAELALSLLTLILASVLLYGLFQWDKLPKLFGVFEIYPYPLTFSGRETVRAFVCWLMMFPPAVIIGACYPLALELVTSNGTRFNSKRLLGSAMGLNTIGNIVGAVAGGFILLPLLGTQKSVWVAAGICLLAGLTLAIVAQYNKANQTFKARLSVFFVLATTVAMFALQPNSFNFTQLASGANVYFQARDNGEVIDHSESLDGGLTTVSLKNTEEHGELKTLLTNGKFQGNNALQGEMKAQVSFAVAPLLHTTQRDSALVIGYGTGVSSRTLKESGFKQLDIVDLSRDLVGLANKHFANVNETVSEQPGVHFYATDGRNFLLLQNRRYDLISMEITSIWFAGAASLYNEEFYTLAKKRLTEQGVLQQWVQLHHITPIDLASILSSIRAVFPYVSLYELGGQGIIVASNQEHQLSNEAMHLIKQQPGLMQLLQQINMKPEDVVANLVLSPQDVNRMIKMFASSSDFHVSTDDNLFLEYSTPKGNALDAMKSTEAIQRFLTQFSTKRAGM